MAVALGAAPLAAHAETGGDATDGLRPGTIVVADTAGDRVQVFNPDGAHAFDIGSRGAADGQFSAPEGAAISADGLIAVADTGNHRVQVFYPNGTFARAFGSQGSAVGQFASPAAVAFAPQGDLLAVADTGNDRVYIYHVDGTKIAVAEYNNHRIQVFDAATGAHLLNFGRGCAPAYAGSFCAPSGVAYSPDGTNLAVSAWGDYGIQIFDAATGEYLSTITSATRSPETLGNAAAVDYSPDGKRIAVADTGGRPHSIVVHDAATGERLVMSGSFDSPRGVAYAPALP